MHFYYFNATDDAEHATIEMLELFTAVCMK